ncbi:MAG TPA: hypothetical protein VJU87_03470 [Gemmatimonadaceae bacterium]|nr:hypothetical protein [Gemmatimonadaceae bacterium]
MTVRPLICTSLLLGLWPDARLAAQKPPDHPPIDITKPPPQPPEPPRWYDPLSGSIQGMWGFPVGAFRQHEDGGGGGVLDVAYALDRARAVSLRASVGYLVYGYVSGHRDVPVYDDYGYWTGYYDNVSFAVRNHSVFSLDVGPQVDWLRGPYRPYAFATGGLSYFASRMNVRPPTSNIDQGDDITVFSHTNFAWAVGTGLRFGGSDPRKGAFQLGITFRRNERAAYANDSAMRMQSDSSVIITPYHGSANLIVISAGFWIGPH